MAAALAREAAAAKAKEKAEAEAASYRGMVETMNKEDEQLAQLHALQVGILSNEVVRLVGDFLSYLSFVLSNEVVRLR